MLVKKQAAMTNAIPMTTIPISEGIRVGDGCENEVNVIRRLEVDHDQRNRHFQPGAFSTGGLKFRANTAGNNLVVK